MRFFFLILSFFVLTDGFSQKESNIIRFEVFAEKNDPLPGVSIIEEGTENKTQTDFEGKAELKVSDLRNKIIFSFFNRLEIDLIEKADLVKVFLFKKSKIEYYKNGKLIQKKLLKQ
ncbi:MAG TPA: hypothetical protein VLZ72_09725 [Flavobacterium sp.]|nr:hypothetical protein [Flavobacterium sp.]